MWKCYESLPVCESIEIKYNYFNPLVVFKKMLLVESLQSFTTIYYTIHSLQGFLETKGMFAKCTIVLYKKMTV